MSSINGSNGVPNSSAFENLTIQSLMSRLQLRPPYLDTNSFLSQSLDEFLLQSQLPDGDGDADADDLPAGDLSGRDGRRRRLLLAKEEAKLEKEIIRIIHIGNPKEALKANSGQSVSVGDHSICVGSHEEPGSEYRVWEWHGHIMFFDEEDGYSAEYIYGNFFERLKEKKEAKKSEAESVEEEDDDDNDEEIESAGNPGLKDLIGDSKDSVGGGGGRILHRNSLNAGSSTRSG